MTTDPIERLDFDTATLMAQHPPVWHDSNKQVVFDIACRPGESHGRLDYTRWAAMPLPDVTDPAVGGDLVLARDGYFDYEPVLDPTDAVEWHVNFADSSLFGFYGSSLLAQDEMQVLEHPAPGALREVLTAEGHDAVTLDHGQPTPVLVMGAERRCHVSTEPNDAEGRPGGLYGTAFGRASPDVVARATTRIDPPTITNVLAMVAPSNGYGRYRVETIEFVLVTAFTGFQAAVLESQRLRGAGVRVAVHTGYWGCGAFGGNRVLMALLQVLAARMAGLDRLVFHTGTPGGRAPLDEALGLLHGGLTTDPRLGTRDVIAAIEAMHFEWGISDGN